MAPISALVKPGSTTDTCSNGLLAASLNTSGATSGEIQALGTAHDYLDSGEHFSRKGLINQLKFEGYSTNDATYGADHCGADWMDQAVGSAKDYLNTQHFSRSGLINQLEFEGFTYAQAAHGADAAL